MAEKDFIQLFAEETPTVSKAFFGFADDLRDNGGLDEKTFQLIYLGIKAAGGETGSVVAHAAYAKKAGATRNEVRGAVMVSLMTNGVTGIASCLGPALESYDKA